MSQPPDIRPNLSLLGDGVRVQAAGVGAVTIPDLGMAKFLLAYPPAWSSLEIIDPERVAAVSAGALTARCVITIKQLLAAGLVREFAEPRDGLTVPADQLPGPLFSDAQEFVTRAAGTTDPDRLTAILATLFDIAPARTRRVVDAYQQRDDR